VLLATRPMITLPEHPAQGPVGAIPAH